ncbi:MAG: nucleotidyltransferase family protein [Chthoniobacteraceae bacterium]
MIAQAFVLGAGLGTRLRPLTAHCPKPLIPVANRPLLTYAFDHLLGAGVERFVVNTHWRAGAYPRAFPDAKYRGAPIVFREENPEVLETAGGIKNVEDVLRADPFWVYNGDILSTLPLAPALAAHREAGNEVTLVLRSSGGPLQVACESGRVLDIGARLGCAGSFLFTGIYLVEPAFLARIPAATKISVVPIFIEMIRTGAKLGGVVIDKGEWFDLGSRDQYLAVHRQLGGPWIDRAAQVAADATVTGASAIGAGAIVGAGARVHDSLVWSGGEIAAGSDVERCIVVGGRCAAGVLRDADVA